jgi:hypothetical protein
MAAGDGVSLPTTLSQMGSVAKTQAKGQQTATHTAPVPERMQADEDLRVNRVKETDGATQDKVDPNKDSPDKRKRRRLRRNRRLPGENDDEASDAAGAGEDDDGDAEKLGRLIDMLA